MRTIPFSVVCIAGLDDGAFPRRDRHSSFNLMSATPRPGDRSLRDDDRYLFLETLLAADRKLILTHVGRTQKDSAHREPSVVLSELVDHIDRTFIAPEVPLGESPQGPSPHHWMRFEHRLQAWSPAYFDREQQALGGWLSSYSKANARAAQALRAGRQSLPRFADTPLPGLEDSLFASHGVFELELRLDDLQRFWQLPCRHLCEQSLGIRLELEEEVKPESEPFLISGTEAYGLRQELLARRLALRAVDPPVDDDIGEGASQQNLDDIEAREIEWLRAEGRLPALGIGIHQWRRQSRRVDSFLKRLPVYEPAPPQWIDLRLDDDDLGYRLSGTLRHGALDDRGTLTQLLSFRCGRLRPQDRLGLWIELLAAAMDARQRGEEPPTALLIGEDLTVHLRAPIDVESRMEDLLQGYRRGLGRPLPFFTEASFAFAEQAKKLADPRNPARLNPLEKARRVFEGQHGPRTRHRPSPDSENPYVRLAFRGLDALDDPDFAHFAERLWQPILDHSREQS